jgi:glutathione peroxidase
MRKIEVNGASAHPVYKYLKSEAGGILGDGIKWNFTKFLVSRDGQEIRRFAPTTTPQALEKDITEFLSQTGKSI